MLDLELEQNPASLLIHLTLSWSKILHYKPTQLMDSELEQMLHACSPVGFGVGAWKRLVEQLFAHLFRFTSPPLHVAEQQTNI